MENPGSISLRVEKKSLQLTKFLKKSPCIIFFRERQGNVNTFKNFLNIVTRIEIMIFFSKMVSKAGTSNNGDFKKTKMNLN